MMDVISLMSPHQTEDRCQLSCWFAALTLTLRLLIYLEGIFLHQHRDTASGFLKMLNVV